MNKRRNKIIIAIVLPLVVLLRICVLLFLATGVYVLAGKGDAGSVSRSISMTIIPSSNGNDTSTEEADYTWYDSIEEAERDTSAIKDSMSLENYSFFIDHPYFTYESEDKTIVFYYRDIFEKRDRLTLGFCMNFIKKDGKYSQPYNSSMVYLGPVSYDRYTYDLCDAVSEEISAQSGFMSIMDFISPDGYQAYCGAWDNYEELSSLTIEGNKVSEIIPLEVEGKTYYFWYYDKSDLTDNMEAIDFSDYTLDEVTEALDLQYTPEQEEEKK